ncbi:MAG: carboxy-S-adenosyl-L-methionine synthase CmoA [Bacteroidales bacterium]|nr:carboxy-S-adenosyl-L-methionine synthase CmoA [Bacteroidales bacterium]
MQIDKIFKTRQERSSDFKFDTSVVDVFDDMVVRSVPFYLEFQRMITEIAKDYATQGSTLCDLGCSTGTTMISLNKVLDPSVKFVGIDNSQEMLDVCLANFKNENFARSFELVYRDLNRSFEIENTSVVILCLALQFIRPVYRFKLLQNIYKQMNPGGCLILVEKILGEEIGFNKQMIKYYYDFKRRNNYDEMEISQKREALENVLIPYKLSENIEMLMEARFTSIEIFFKWYNFAGIVAFKN